MSAGACAEGPFAATPAAYCEFLFTVQPEQLLVIDEVALTLEQDVEAPIAKARSYDRAGAPE